MTEKDCVEKAVRDIRRKTRRKFSTEEKIRMALEGRRSEESIGAEEVQALFLRPIRGLRSDPRVR